MLDVHSTTEITTEQSERAILTDDQLKVLRDRGISDETIRAAGLIGRRVPSLAMREWMQKHDVMRGEAIEELQGAPLFPVPGILIKYPRTKTQEKRHWRVRYDSTTYEVRIPMDHSGAEGTEERDCPRYQAAGGMGVIPYIPSLFEKREDFTPGHFRDIDAASPGRRMFVTEAPLKCLSLYSHGFPGVGLGGVLAGAHRPQKAAGRAKEIVAHAELRRLVWKDRAVYTCFDAGQKANPLVALGVAYSWKAFESLGARVSTMTIPDVASPKDGTDKAKDQGPDDFLVKHGVEAFEQLIEDAYPTSPVARVKTLAALPASERTPALLELTKDLVFLACLHVSSKTDHQLVTAASKKVISATLIKEALAEFRASLQPEQAPEDSWKSEFCRAGNGAIRPIGQNVELCLRNDAGLQGLLAFDEFAQNLKFRKTPPWLDHYTASADVSDGTWWAREDYTRLSYHVGRVYDVIDTPREKLEEAVVLISRENRYHPVQDYLRGLKWDGSPRVDTLLQAYLGVQEGVYSRLVSRLFVLQAAARILKPGCKADLILVLEGEQGIRKSTFLRALASDEWFTDEPLGDLADKETAMKLQGHWVVELGEGEILAKASQKALKAFTAKTYDDIIPKYSNLKARLQRQCVFAITTNEGEYLTDTTGNRRYLPVACADEEVDVESFLAVRDQLWAEAVMRIDAGEKWHLTRADQLLFASQTEARMVEDVWLEGIQRFLEKRLDDEDLPNFVSVSEILIGIEQHRNAGRRESNRVSDCLRRLGWVCPRESTQHSRKGVRLWSPGPRVSGASDCDSSDDDDVGIDSDDDHDDHGDRVEDMLANV